MRLEKNALIFYNFRIMLNAPEGDPAFPAVPLPTAAVTTAGACMALCPVRHGKYLLRELDPRQIAAGPLDDVTEIAKSLKNEDNLMLVGYFPFVQRFAGSLNTALPGIVVLRFQNGGIVCLNKDPDGKSLLTKWTLMPGIE